MGKVLNILFCLYYLILFVSLFFGYCPNKVEMGVAFLISAMSFMHYSLN